LFLEGRQSVKRQPGRQRADRQVARRPPAPEARQRVKPDAVVARVTEMITPLCAAEGMELVLVEYRREPGGRVLRLIIDRPGGVAVDDCVAISRQAGDYLDVALGVEEAYRLEVSSPGTQRPLVRPEDFDRFKGQLTRIRTRTALDGRRNYKGTLLGISEGTVHLSVDGVTVAIAFDDIERARLAG